MFVTKRKLKKDQDKYTVQIIDSKRISGKTKQTTIKYIGYAKTEDELNGLLAIGSDIKQMILERKSEAEIDLYLKKHISLIKGCSSKILDCKHIYTKIIGFHDIYSPVLKYLELDKIIDSMVYHDVLLNLIIARIYNPSSKLHSSVLLKDDLVIHLPVQAIYMAMDKIDEEIITKIKSNVAYCSKNLIKDGLKVLFYDATTLYFESFTEDELKKNGYSKDLKFNQPQVLLTIVVSNEGLPIDYKLFPGSTYEGHTLQVAIESVIKNHEGSEMVLVADSGMLNQENIDYLENNNIKYILGARLKNQTKAITEQILAIDNSSKEDSYTTIEINKAKNLIISYREKRAHKHRKDREKNIAKVQAKIEKSQDPKSLLSNYGYKKYLDIAGTTEIVVNEEKITLDAKWDGLHGIITNVKNIAAQEIYAQYRGLWQVEEAFRVNKSDLKIRPIFHWTPDRIQSHVAISYIAFSCVRILQQLLKEQNINLSCKEIAYHLARTTVAIWQDQTNNKTICVPNNLSDIAKEIYNAMSIKFYDTPFELAA